MAILDKLENTFMMKNTTDRVIGFYSTDNGGGICSEMWELVSLREMTASNTWFFWDSGLTSDPAQWTREAGYWLSQDEGKALLKMIEPDDQGNVTIQFNVIGLGEDSTEEVLRSDVVKFEKMSDL